MKKTLAIILALALVLCMMPSAAFAADPVETTLTNGEKIAAIEITGGVDLSYLYTGDEVKPKPVVTARVVNETAGATGYPKQVTLASSEYSTAYEANTNAGTAKVKVSVAENKTQSAQTIEVEKNFQIKKIAASDVQVKYDGYFTGSVNDVTGIDQNKLIVTCDNATLIKNFYTIKSVSTDSGQKTVTITITLTDPKNGTGNVEAVDKFVDVPIKKSLSNYEIRYTAATTAIPDQQYTGAALTPTVGVFLKAGAGTGLKSTLSLGTDYDIQYTNNVNKGSYANVIVTGKGDYASDSTDGTLTASFKIVGRPISSSGITYSVSSGVQNGANPTVVVKDGTKTLVQAVNASGNGDYYISSCSNSVVGTGRGSVTIVGIGNYDGSRSIPFDVTDAKNQITSARFMNGVTSPSSYYNGGNQTPAVEVYANGVKITSGYSLRYERRTTDTNGNKVTTLKDAGTYDVYAYGNYPYAGEYYVGQYQILPVPLDWAEIVLNSSTTTYGSYTVPKVSVRHISGGFYFPETDYTVSYRYLGSTATYLKPTVVITPNPNGNLTTGSNGKTSLEKEITYSARSISNCTVNFTDYRSSKVYDGTVTKPTVVVRDYSQNRTLVLNSDYTVTYKDAAGKTVTGFRDAGTYTVEIRGAGAYSGTTTLTYTITGTDISRYTVTLNTTSVNATGTAQRPTIVSVKYGTTSTLSSADYEVSYQDSTGKTVTSMITPGMYKVVVSGKNGYSGSTSASFRIVGTPQQISIPKTAYKVYKDSESFRITATATGDGTGFSYVSSDPSVATVSATGVVTIHKIGRAKITVTTTGMKKSDPAFDDVYVKVYPDKEKITQKPFTEGKTKSFRVRWDKQDDVTYYEVRYARNSSFRAGTYTTKKVNASTLNYDTQSTQIKTSYSKARYYVKVRAVKVVYNDYGQELKYYGTWSNWRSVVTR